MGRPPALVGPAGWKEAVTPAWLSMAGRKVVENGPKTQKSALAAGLALSVSMGFLLSVSGSLPPSLPVTLGFRALAAATVQKTED